jgi:hypothetical protein
MDACIPRFYPSQARAIAEDIVKSELDAQSEYSEEDSRAWAIEIGNRVREALTSK